MASKHLGLVKAAGGQISLHSMHGRHLMRAALLDTHLLPDAGALHSSSMSVGGEQSLYSRYGNFLTKTAMLGTGQTLFRSIEGEVPVRSPLGEVCQP